MIHADVEKSVRLGSFPEANHQVLGGEWKIPLGFDRDDADLALAFLNDALSQFSIGARATVQDEAGAPPSGQFPA